MKSFLFIVLVALFVVGYCRSIEEDDGSSENMIINDHFLYDETPAKFITDKQMVWLPTFQGKYFPRVSFDADHVQYYLLTRSNPYKNVTWNGNEQTPKVDKTKKTKVLIHGWMNDINNAWYEELSKAYLEEEDYNIILVDWSKESKYLDYFKSAGSTMKIGHYIGDQLMNMDLDVTKVHVIGHSLGGQVAGFCGKFIYINAYATIERITALDPARPYFENNDAVDRLSAQDAKVVDVIHTDAGTLGCEKAIGTIDFYPNGGSHQPGCRVLKFLPYRSCSHARSYYLFIESIKSKKLIGYKCDSKASFENGSCNQNEKNILGEHVHYRSQGVFYLKTGDSAPFHA